MAREKTWTERTSEDCRKRAQRRLGVGWSVISDDQREAFIALEIVKVLLAQDDGHAHEQVKRLQGVARRALDAGSRTVFEAALAQGK